MKHPAATMKARTRRGAAPDSARAKHGQASAQASPRVALVVKRTAWDEWVEQRRDERIRKLLRDHDDTVARMKAAHEEHVTTLALVERALGEGGAVVDRINGRGAILHPQSCELVVTVGGDGTLLRASHDVVGVPILGVNSAPNHSVGFFCGARGDEASRAIASALSRTLEQVSLTRMRVRRNGQVVAPRVLNDCLFCHASPAATSRYLVYLGKIREEHKSSGFWIGPAAGSTAAQRSAGGRVLPLTSKKLQLVVREPYTPHGESYAIRRALVPEGEAVRVKSKMHEALLFPDGAEGLNVCYGDELVFEASPEPLLLLGRSGRRRWG